MGPPWWLAGVDAGSPAADAAAPRVVADGHGPCYRTGMDPAEPDIPAPVRRPGGGGGGSDVPGPNGDGAGHGHWPGSNGDGDGDGDGDSRAAAHDGAADV